VPQHCFHLELEFKDDPVSVNDNPKNWNRKAILPIKTDAQKLKKKFNLIIEIKKILIHLALPEISIYLIINQLHLMSTLNMRIENLFQNIKTKKSFTLLLVLKKGKNITTYHLQLK
jgi:hypothetical protein